jgi:hypothetical protein
MQLRLHREVEVIEFGDAGERHHDVRVADIDPLPGAGDVETGRATIDDGPLRIGTRAGTKTLTRSELGFEVDLGLFAVAPDEVRTSQRPTRRRCGSP